MKIGIDLGTANILVFVQGRGITVREPSVVVIGDRDRILAVGNEAREMIGRTPGGMTAVRPLRDGVIADYVVTEAMLRYFIKKGTAGKLTFGRPDVLVSVPASSTSVEKRYVLDAARQAGAGKAYLIEEPMAAAIGAELPISGPSGNMIVNIGGGTTEIAVLSLSEIVVSKSHRVGGNRFDEAIALYIRRKYNLMIGDRTAEQVKFDIGSAVTMDKELTMSVKGRDMIAGLPREVTISSTEITEALEVPLRNLTDAVRSVLEQTPPELSADIIDKGIVISGGGALLRNMDRLITTVTGVAAHVAPDPLSCVAKGTGIALEHFDVFAKSLTSHE